MYRMKKVFLYILSISLLVILVACSNTKDNLIGLTQEEKIEDFDYLYEVLKGHYPMFGVAKRQYKIDWLCQKEIYLENTSENWRQYMMYTDIPGYSVYVTTEPNNGENIIRCVNINYNDRILVGCQERNEFYDESGNII